MVQITYLQLSDINSFIETRTDDGSDQVLTSIENQAKTPLKLENHLKNFEYEINNLKETKRGILMQLGVQSTVREGVYSKPEYDDNLAELTRLIQIEKFKVQQLS